MLLGLLFIAVAISLDAFSMSLGMGVYTLSISKIFTLGYIVGLFHIIMPLMGIVIGRFLSIKLGMITAIIGGLLIMVLGLQLIYSSIKKKDERSFSAGISMWIFALSVSLDSFSVGLSLGMVGVKLWISILFFGIVSMIFTWIGLLLGGKVHRITGRYGEMLGGIILLLFGVKMLFGQ